jgi:hypothetical protein
MQENAGQPKSLKKFNKKERKCKKIERYARSPFAELFPQLRPQTVANHQPEHADR